MTARFESPIGEMSVTSSDRGLCYVSLPRANGRGLEGWRRRHAPDESLAQGLELNQEPIRQLLDFLAGKRAEFDLDLDLRGTPFQVEVYRAVASIPYGEDHSEYSSLVANHETSFDLPRFRDPIFEPPISTN